MCRACRRGCGAGCARSRRGPLDGLRVEHDEVGLVARSRRGRTRPASRRPRCCRGPDQRRRRARRVGGRPRSRDCGGAGRQVVLVRGTGTDGPEEAARRARRPAVARLAKAWGVASSTSQSTVAGSTVQRPSHEGRSSGIDDDRPAVRVAPPRCGARPCRSRTSWFCVETGSAGHADESVGEEHDVVIG